MKKPLLLVILVCIHLPVLFSQSIGVEKIITLGNQGWDIVSDLAVDNEGNYYVTGSFTGQIDIGDSLFTSAGQRDIFIIKLDSLNMIKWAKRIGGEGDEHAHSISCKNSNQIYLAGSFSDQLDLSSPIQAEGISDVFYTQLDQNGAVQWSKALHSSSAAYKMLLEADFSGNFYLAGSFKNNLQLNDSTGFTSQSAVDIFFARFDTNGDLLTHKHIPGDGNDRIYDMVIDPDNNIYLGGGYEENLHFAPNNVNSYGKEDLYLVKYDSLANRQWYKIAGGVYNDKINALTLDNKGNIYAACGFELSTKIGTSVYTASRQRDVILIKSVVSNGDPAWIKQLSGNSKNTVSSLAFGSDKIYLSGNFKGAFQSENEYTSEGAFEDAYISCFTENGDMEWFQKAGGSKEDNIWLKYQATINKIVSTGYFNNDFTFSSHQSTNNNFSDVFLGSLIDCELVPKVNLGADTTLCSGTALVTDKEYVSYSWNTGSVAGSIYPDTSGTYSVLVEDVYGCFSEDTIEIVITPSPEFELGTQIALPGDSLLVLDPGLIGSQYTYLWSTLSTEATLSIPMSSITAPTLFSLTVTDQNNNCEYTDDVLVVNEDVPPPVAMGAPPSDEKTTDKIKVDTEEKQDEEAVETMELADYKLYPNPNKGKVYLVVPKDKQVKQVDVFDMQGMEILTYRSISSNPIEINLANQPKGVYLVVVREEKMSREYKIIRE